MQNNKTYKYSEFIDLCTFKDDIKKSIELLKLNEVNTLNFKHEFNSIQFNSIK